MAIIFFSLAAKTGILGQNQTRGTDVESFFGSMMLLQNPAHQ
jgi:hypothetical protein